VHVSPLRRLLPTPAYDLFFEVFNLVLTGRGEAGTEYCGKSCEWDVNHMPGLHGPRVYFSKHSPVSE